MLAMGKIKCTDEESGLDRTSDMSKKHEKIGKPSEKFWSALKGAEMKIKLSSNTYQ